MNWPSPGNDPWYAANPTQSFARRTFYNVNATPTHLIDGASAGGTSTTVTAAYQSRLATPSPVWLSMTSVLATNDSIYVTIKAVAEQPITGNVKLRALLVEKEEFWTTPAPNGQTHFPHPFVMFAPDENGWVFNHTGNTSDTLTFTTVFAPRTSGPQPYTLDNCRVMAIVQSDVSKEVIQAATSGVVFSPTAGSYVLIGRPNQIRWNAFLQHPVNLFINRSYPSANWDTIATEIPNTGQYEWTATGTPVSNARFRVSSSQFAWNADTSQGNVMLTYPVDLIPSQTSFEATLEPDQSITTNLVLTNNDSLAFNGTLALRTGSNSYNTIQTVNPGGPAAEWIDITSLGVVGAMGNDVTTGPYTLPFSFPFFGQPYNQVWMNSNGWLTFNSTTGTFWQRQALPFASLQTLLAVFWDDLVVAQDTGTARVYMDTINMRAIFSWQNARRWNSTATHIDAQAILYPDGTFRFNYRNVQVLDQRTTIGIQNENRSRFINLYVATSIPQFNSIVFSYSPYWANTTAPTTLTVPANDSITIPVILSSQFLAPNVYTGTWLISGNGTPLTIPFMLTVTGVGVSDEPKVIPSGYALENAYPNPFNPMTYLGFTIPRNEEVTLKLFDLTGREIYTLHQGKLSAGSYKLPVKMVHFASGTYLVQMSAGNFKAVKKIVLLK